MTKEILLAKSGSEYLKIKKKGKKTVIIFDTQEYIFDYIYEKLDVQIEEKGNMDIEDLSKYCTDETYPIFLKAFELKDELYDFWAAFFEDAIIDGDAGQYDPQFYDIKYFIGGDEYGFKKDF